MKPFGIAGIQMNLHHGSNVDAIEEHINVLMSLYPWVEMVIISELAAHGPLHDFAETMPGVTENRFCEMAKAHKIWLVPGSFFELRNNAIFNTAPVINPQGEVIARHRKLFPFCPFEEGVSAGDEFVVFDIPNVGRFGLCICYDMWFPEVLRTLTTMGAEVILHPVLTGTNDRDIELNLARSSGALFQSYIIDINGLGVGGVGKSCIIDPAGHVIHQAGETAEYLVTELDFDLVRRQREVGLRSLGQPLKSFRDSKIDFTVYNKTQYSNAYLDSLGPIQKPSKIDKTSQAKEPSTVMPLPMRDINIATPLHDFQGLEASAFPHEIKLDIPDAEPLPQVNIDTFILDDETSDYVNKIQQAEIPKNIEAEDTKAEEEKKISTNTDKTANRWLKNATFQLKNYIK
jgi:predicted amidohydrolase